MHQTLKAILSLSPNHPKWLPLSDYLTRILGHFATIDYANYEEEELQRRIHVKLQRMVDS